MAVTGPNQSSPESHIWFSVETPNAFRETKLPANSLTWSKLQWQQFHKLTAMAERHGTSIRRSSYRRG